MNIFFIIVFIFTTITNAAVKTHTKQVTIIKNKKKIKNKKEENHHRHK